MKKVNYMSGQQLSEYGITYVSDAPSLVGKTNVSRRMAKFKCHCNKIFVCKIGDVKSGRRKSCGCRKGNRPNVYKEGDLINGIKFIRSCGTTKYAQRAIFECPICKHEWESLVSNIQAGNTKSCCKRMRGWSRTNWKSLSPVSILYKIRMYNDNESFIKIGITKNSVKERYISTPYKYEILKIIEGESGYIFDLEKRTIRLFRKYKYIPLIEFGGITECYYE